MDITAEMIGQALLGLVQNVKATGAKHDAGTTPATTGYVHGPGGLLSYPGVDPVVFHTNVGFIPGVMNSIPAVPTRFDTPLFEIVTGIKADAAGQEEAAGVCDVAPVGGTMKAGIVTFRFGRYQRRTRTIELNRLGHLNNRAEPMDLQLVGQSAGANVFGGPANGAFPQGQILTNEIDAVMQERAVSLNRQLQRQVWTGNPGNNNAGGGYAEFAGLDLLINTNWRDALTGNALPSLYPTIFNFALKQIDSNGPELVNQVTYLARQVRDLAERTGVSNVRWAFTMRPALFFELTKVWPCAYFTNLCTFGAGTATDIRQNIDLGDQTAMRDAMRQGRYLLIDGERWDVILDDAIVEYSNTTLNGVTSGCFSSDIYLLPMSVSGRATLYFEYFDFSNASLASALGQGMVLARVLGGGAWLETIRQTLWCVDWQAKIEPRLILRTPWLAGRITNVQYCPLIQTRQPFPDSAYWVNGGEVSRPGPSLYNPF